MSLKALIQGIGRKILGTKKVSSSPATGQQQKLITYDKQASKKTGEQLAKEELNLPATTTPLNKTQPLHMGDDTAPMFGSSTYDWIMKKGRGKFSADEWLDHLTSTRKVNFKIFGKPASKTERGPKQFKYDSGPFKGKEVTINKEELFDANLANFDEAGELTGGLLYAAQKFGLKLDANTLGAMIKLNPVNRLQPVELGLPKGAGEVLNVQGEVIRKTLADLAKQAETKNLLGVGEELTEAAYKAASMKTSMDASTISKAGKGVVDHLKKINKSQDLSQQQKIKINQLIGETNKVIKPYTDKNIATRYKNESSYTLQGGDDYRETVFRLNEDIPGNSALRKTFGHFDGVNQNMVYHVRFDTRFTPDNKKVLMIHEIQSDANQKVAKALTKFEQLDGTKRINPFQKDLEISLLSKNRSQLLKEVDTAIEQGQTNRANAIMKDLADVNRKINQTYRAKDDYSDKAFDYFPLVEADSYGDHALKYLMNKAAKENADYVAVIPFDKLSFRQGYKAGNERFYGYASGKGIGKKGKAVLPDLMKRDARFYDTKAGPIKVSLSDPKKPYKIKQTDSFDYPESSGMKGKKFTSKYHDDAISVDEYNSLKDKGSYKFMDAADPNLYFDAFAIKVNPLMRQTLKTYKSTGGLVVDIFKPIR
tara:strand:+ start:98 stop:2050 length:1953 start_codon:yes stop_codon:yes gene_type:complete